MKIPIEPEEEDLEMAAHRASIMAAGVLKHAKAVDTIRIGFITNAGMFAVEARKMVSRK